MSLPFAYLTTRVDRIVATRQLAAALDYPLRVLAPDAPLPQPEEYIGVLVDLEVIPAPARKELLTRLARFARVGAVGVHSRATTADEAAFLRAAGIRWALTPRTKLLTDVLARVRVVDLSDPATEAAPEPQAADRG